MSKTIGVHEYPKTKSVLSFELKMNGGNAKIGVSVKNNLFLSSFEALQSVCVNLRGSTGPSSFVVANYCYVRLTLLAAGVAGEVAFVAVANQIP